MDAPQLQAVILIDQASEIIVCEPFHNGSPHLLQQKVWSIDSFLFKEHHSAYTYFIHRKRSYHCERDSPYT